MKKYLLLVVLFVLGFAVVAYAAWDGATNYPAALDDAASLYDVEDAGTVEDEHHDALAQAVIAIETKLGIGTLLREFTAQAYTASGNISEAQILASKYLTNQGEDAAENDLVLPDVSYPIQVIFIVEEAFIIEINPPDGEAFDLDGTVLDANDCVDSPIVVGSKISATRMQIADASWRWSLDTIRGAWVDIGASD